MEAGATATATGSRANHGSATGAAGAQSPDEREYQLEFRCGLGEILGLTLVTGLLTVVTLTIYRFWGRTRVRRLLWRRTLLLGDPLEYAGTGWELFVGFLKVLVLVILPLVLVERGIAVWEQSAIQDAIAEMQTEIRKRPAGTPLPNMFAIMWSMKDHMIGPWLSRYAYLGLVVFLIGFGVYVARRYRLTRTRWRGVRGNQDGRPLAYAGRYLGFVVALIFTLGLVLPLRNASLWRYRYRHTLFGSTRFSSTASARGLYGRFLLCWLLLLPTLFMSLAWYKAKELRHFVAATHFGDGLTFRLNATGWSLLRLGIGNILITIFTLGLGSPIVQYRQARYVAKRLVAFGSTDLNNIRYDPRSGPGTGEGLADAFPDIGM